MVEFTTVLDNLDPDVVITIADRYETMAACYQNIPIVHTQGGEITGSIDEKVRHATTKLADYHMVSTDRSAEVVNRLGEDEDRIYNVGCPSIDIADDIAENADPDYDPQDDYGGVGEAVDELCVQAFWFWPNMDAGTDKVSKAIREARISRTAALSG